MKKLKIERKICQGRPPYEILGVPGRKRFECFGEQHKSEFAGKHLWQSMIVEKVGAMALLALPSSEDLQGAKYLFEIGIYSRLREVVKMTKSRLSVT